jgi:hypothetical protein
VADAVAEGKHGEEGSKTKTYLSLQRDGMNTLLRLLTFALLALLPEQDRCTSCSAFLRQLLDRLLTRLCHFELVTHSASSASKEIDLVLVYGRLGGVGAEELLGRREGEGGLCLFDLRGKLRGSRSGQRLRL